MDPWIHGSAAGAAGAAAVCIYCVIIGGRFVPPYMYIHDKVHTAAAEAAAPAAAPAAALAAAPAADPWIHGSISFIGNHIPYSLKYNLPENGGGDSWEHDGRRIARMARN